MAKWSSWFTTQILESEKPCSVGHFHPTLIKGMLEQDRDFKRHMCCDIKMFSVSVYSYIHLFQRHSLTYLH